MHNTTKANAEFETVWCENNIRWLLGDETPNRELIAKHRRQIAILQTDCTNLERDDHGFFLNAQEVA